MSYSLSRKIKQIDIKTKKVIKIYDSAQQAAIAVKGFNINILSVCDKKYCYNTAYGYIWRYIDDSSISAALTGKSKTCKNFIWKYDAIER